MMFKFSKICERFVKTTFLVRLYNFYRKPPPEECPPAPPPPPEKLRPPRPLEGDDVMTMRAEDIVVLSEEAKARVV